MTRVYVGVGSNIDRRANVARGLAALRGAFGELTISTVYQTPAIGFEGDDFYNLVVGFDTEADPHVVAERLRRIEFDHGRKRDIPRFSARTLDLDLLIYGDRVIDDADLTIPRDDIEKYGFVLGPLAEIAPHERHPVGKKSFGEMWADFDQEGARLTPVDDLCPRENE